MGHRCSGLNSKGIRVSLFCGVAEEQPVGRVSNLRVVETLGSTVRLGWTGVAGATQYRISILNTEGDAF